MDSTSRFAFAFVKMVMMRVGKSRKVWWSWPLKPWTNSRRSVALGGGSMMNNDMLARKEVVRGCKKEKGGKMVSDDWHIVLAKEGKGSSGFRIQSRDMYLSGTATVLIVAFFDILFFLFYYCNCKKRRATIYDRESDRRAKVSDGLSSNLGSLAGLLDLFEDFLLIGCQKDVRTIRYLLSEGKASSQLNVIYPSHSLHFLLLLSKFDKMFPSSVVR